MKKTILAAKVLTMLSLLLSIGCAALRTWLLTNAYSIEDGFYTNATLHTVLNTVLFGFAVLAFAAGHIYIKERNRLHPLPENPIFRVAAVFSGCAMAGFILYTFAKFVLPNFERPQFAALLMLPFALISAAYYFAGSKKETHNGDFRALLCLCPALVLLILVFGLYFDSTVSYINHSVVLCFAASIFTILAGTAEANSMLGRPCYRRYLSYAPTAVTLCFTLSIPDLLFYCTNRAVVLTDIYYDILLFAFGLYHLARLFALALQTNKEEI